MSRLRAPVDRERQAANWRRWYAKMRAERPDQYERYLAAKRRRTGAPRRGPRFPLAPLEQLAGHPSLHELARRVGEHQRAVSRARSEGLTVWKADAYAVAYDLHPAIVWDDWGGWL